MNSPERGETHELKREHASREKGETKLSEYPWLQDLSTALGYECMETPLWAGDCTCTWKIHLQEHRPGKGAVRGNCYTWMP